MHFPHHGPQPTPASAGTSFSWETPAAAPWGWQEALSHLQPQQHIPVQPLHRDPQPQRLCRGPGQVPGPGSDGCYAGGYRAGVRENRRGTVPRAPPLPCAAGAARAREPVGASPRAAQLPFLGGNGTRRYRAGGRPDTGCGIMQRLGLLGLLGAALLGCWDPGDAVRCFDKQYEYRGRCCNRCHPGEKLVSECSDTEDSICTPCESGHYQQSWTKEKHCAPHDICEDNTGLIVKTHGNATHNTVCQCRAGMHCSDTSCQTCVENQPCQRGFGFVVAKAMARMTSPCEPCAEGTFSNVSSKTEPCHPWTSCEEKGLMVKVKGTNTSDVICESDRRSSLSVLIPIAAVAVTCLMGISIYYYLVHRDPKQQMQKQGKPGRPEENLETHQPTEEWEDPFPVQETLLRGQPVAQEDGKESRIAEQERL